ncbi:hypothetical protein PGB90_005981 [Kerria lacca]
MVRVMLRKFVLFKMHPSTKHPTSTLPVSVEYQKRRIVECVHCGCPENNQNEDEDSFFDLLSRFQSKRMDDRRCSLTIEKAVNSKNGVTKDGALTTNAAAVSNGDAQDDLLDLIMGIQSKRMDEQRVELPNLPDLCRSSISSDTELIENLKVNPHVIQLDDKGESFPHHLDDKERPSSSSKKSTVPDEDFFSLISRLQSGRMDDQRAKLKK